MSSPPPGKILFARQADVLCLRLEGRITFSLGPGFTDFIGQIFARDDWIGIVIDLTAATTLDSTALGLLAKIARLLRQRRDQAPVIISSQPRITSALRNVGLERLMTIVAPDGGTAPDLRAVPGGDPTKSAQARVVLDAHRELMSLNEKNAGQFRTVVEYLEKEMGD